MDSNRRHDLETNDLKDFLDNFKDFWNTHGNKVLVVLIVALLAYAGPKYYSNWERSKANDASAALESATEADTLLAVAEEHPLVGDEARRRAADLLLGQARHAKIADDTDATDKALKRAASAYTAIAQQGRTIPYQLVGYEGLAKVAIMQGQWQEAEAHLKTIIKLAGDVYQMQAARAKSGIQQLEVLSKPVSFSPPKPATIDPLAPLQGPDRPTTGFDPVLPSLNLPGLNSVSPPTPPNDDQPDKPEN